MGDFDIDGRWNPQLASAFPLPTDEEILRDEYSTAQVMDMWSAIQSLEAENQKLREALAHIKEYFQNYIGYLPKDVREAALSGEPE